MPLIFGGSLIKLWYTPNAGAAAVSSTPNMVRGPSSALWETGCSEGGWYYCACALQVSPWLFRDGHKVSKERLGFPKVVSKCPLENPSPAIYSKSTLLCRALGAWPVPAAYSDPCSPQRNQRMQVPCILIFVPLSCTSHRRAGRVWPLARLFFVFHESTE